MTVARTTGETVSERVFHHNQHELYRRVKQQVSGRVAPSSPWFGKAVLVAFRAEIERATNA